MKGGKRRAGSAAAAPQARGRNRADASAAASAKRGGDRGAVHQARVRWVREGAAVTGARYVLYWLQINQRERLNDALDFAIEQADALDLPVVVYQGLRPDYPGANDRLHAFLLEGAADLSRALAGKGIRYLFHLERRPSAAGGLLAALARDAALVVTDDFPVFIVPGQTRALASQIERPLAAVDASCVVPWSIFQAAETAARTFRPKLHRALPFHLLRREDIAPRRRSEDLDVPFPFPREGLESEERDWLDLGARTRIAEWVARALSITGSGPRRSSAEARARRASVSTSSSRRAFPRIPKTATIRDKRQRPACLPTCTSDRFPRWRSPSPCWKRPAAPHRIKASSLSDERRAGWRERAAGLGAVRSS
jgi:hypothetical protein